MKVLAVDTSTVMATCCIMDEERILGQYSLNQDLSHLENLVPMIKEILDNLNLKIKDIDLFAVAKGPGSFTGLRIAIATMKSFAQIYDKPIVGVSTLEGLAYNLKYQGLTVPMIDARRDRVYTAAYKFEKGKLKEIIRPDAIEINSLIELIKDEEDIMINGNGLFLYRDKLKEELGDRVKFPPLGLVDSYGPSIGELALEKYKEGYRDDYYLLVPEYLRESQAQRELNKKESDEFASNHS